MSTRRGGLGERGSITPFAIIVAIALIALAALVIDGGRQLNAKSRALAYAEEAARAGAQMIRLGYAEALIDPAAAREEARTYCEQAQSVDSQLTGCVPDTYMYNPPGDDEPILIIEVEAEVTIQPVLTSIIGMDDLTATARARARPYQGIEEVDAGLLDELPPVTTQPPNGNPNDDITTDFTEPPPGEIPTCPSWPGTTFTIYPTWPPDNVDWTPTPTPPWSTPTTPIPSDLPNLCPPPETTDYTFPPDYTPPTSPEDEGPDGPGGPGGPGGPDDPGGP